MHLYWRWFYAHFDNDLWSLKLCPGARQRIEEKQNFCNEKKSSLNEFHLIQ